MNAMFDRMKELGRRLAGLPETGPASDESAGTRRVCAEVLGESKRKRRQGGSRGRSPSRDFDFARRECVVAQGNNNNPNGKLR